MTEETSNSVPISSNDLPKSTLAAFGVETLTVIAGAVADVVNVISKVLAGKMFALFDLVGPVMTLRKVDFVIARQELGELDETERKTVEDAFKARLNLADAQAQAKVIAGVGFLEEAFLLVEEGIVVGTKAVDLIQRVRTFLGV